jgi:hypothetical protein
MAKNKLLNLDELATEEKVIKLDGIVHPMREMTVQEFINKAKAARGLGDQPAEAPKDIDAQIEAVIGMIDDAFPSIGKERLGRLSLPQLNAILEFALAPPEKIAAEVEAAQAAGNG